MKMYRNRTVYALFVVCLSLLASQSTRTQTFAGGDKPPQPEEGKWQHISTGVDTKKEELTLFFLRNGSIKPMQENVYKFWVRKYVFEKETKWRPGYALILIYLNCKSDKFALVDHYLYNGSGHIKEDQSFETEDKDLTWSHIQPDSAVASMLSAVCKIAVNVEKEDGS